jgi:hypothetical protein
MFYLINCTLFSSERLSRYIKRLGYDFDGSDLLE